MIEKMRSSSPVLPGPCVFALGVRASFESAFGTQEAPAACNCTFAAEPNASDGFAPCLAAWLNICYRGGHRPDDNHRPNPVFYPPGQSLSAFDLSEASRLMKSHLEEQRLRQYSVKEVNNDASFNLSSLQKGIYFARINNGNKEKVEKIILN